MYLLSGSDLSTIILMHWTVNLTFLPQCVYIYSVSITNPRLILHSFSSKWTCIQAMCLLLLQFYYVTTTRVAFKKYVSQEWAHCHIQLLSFLFFYRWTNEWRWRVLNGISGNLSSREPKWYRMLHSRWCKDRCMKESTQYVVFCHSLCDLTADILHAITLQQCQTCAACIKSLSLLV